MNQLTVLRSGLLIDMFDQLIPQNSKVLLMPKSRVDSLLSLSYMLWLLLVNLILLYASLCSKNNTLSTCLPAKANKSSWSPVLSSPLRSFGTLRQLQTDNTHVVTICCFCREQTVGAGVVPAGLTLFRVTGWLLGVCSMLWNTVKCRLSWQWHAED